MVPSTETADPVGCVRDGSAAQELRGETDSVGKIGCGGDLNPRPLGYEPILGESRCYTMFDGVPRCSVVSTSYLIVVLSFLSLFYGVFAHSVR